MDAYPGHNFHNYIIYIDSIPLEIRYMGAYPGVGACPGHYGIYCIPLNMLGITLLNLGSCAVELTIDKGISELIN